MTLSVASLLRSTSLATVLALAAGGAASAANVPGFNADSTALRNAITAVNVRAHMRELYRLARRSGGTRADGTHGFDTSVNYVRRKLREAGYAVKLQRFEFALFEENSNAELQRLTPTARTYVIVDDFDSMTYSGSGNITGNLVATNDLVLPPGPTASSSNSGCEASDFTPAGSATAVALVQRGTCDFVVKAANAQAAGYDAVVIFNEGQPGRTDTLLGTLGSTEVTIPVLGTSFAVGNELASLLEADPVSLRVKVDATITTTDSTNVLADTKGNGSKVVVVGGHLNSVPEGPGINDNGSGVAGILEIAIQMAKLGIEPRNRVRFAFWGGEESGLFGSQYYVDNLTDAQFNGIGLNLNFDMIASPNFVRFVYDGNGDAFGLAGPPGSDVIEAVFEQFFGRRNLPTKPTAFDGRSDYFAFINAGIPAGGLFTGAEDAKSEEEAEIFGGTAGIAYDPCYHQACDDIRNNNRRVLGQMTDAAADAVLKFAQSSASLAPAAGQARAMSALAASRMDYRGSRLIR